MGLFDKFKKKKEVKLTLRDLILEDYTQKYQEECHFIWENYVPSQGQSEILQGELLREIEKIRHEAQENGNINWDGDYSYFCEYIKRILCNMSIYSEEECLKITLIMDYLKYCGEYASHMENSEDIEINSIAYTKDNLYDMIADMIGKLQNLHPDPIACDINYALQR